jgi:cytochrome c peroxidase
MVMGLVRDYFAERAGPRTPADEGRFNVTHDEQDRHVFKVPTLRNVALTAPYFHDGRAATLEQAVTLMARYQVGAELAPDEAQSIATFLRALTGELPQDALPPAR